MGERPAGEAIETVGVVGAGTMGGGIAISLAQHGFHVRVVDAKPGAADAAREQARAFWARAVEKGRLDRAAAAAALDRFVAADTLDDLAAADLVIEAVFEDFALKAQVFEALSAIARPEAVLATNTSCLRVGDLAAHVRRPERFLGLHYFSPAQVNPVVEVVQGAATADAVAEAGVAFTRAHGKEPIRCADNYGFAINRFFCPYTNEAARAVDDGLGTPAEIDLVAREVVGSAAGPFQVQNLIKPRINLHAIRNLEPLGPFYAPAASMIEVGEADRSWELGEPGALDGDRRRAIAERLMLGCFLPILQALDERVAEPAAFDHGARAALRFANPPCALMDGLGREAVAAIIEPALKRHALPVPVALERVGSLLASSS